MKLISLLPAVLVLASTTAFAQGGRGGFDPRRGDGGRGGFDPRRDDGRGGHGGFDPRRDDGRGGRGGYDDGRGGRGGYDDGRGGRGGYDPRPMPPPPPMPPQPRVSYVTCGHDISSVGYCAVGNATVALYQTLGGNCIQGMSWGNDRGNIWVRNCFATFQVVTYN